MQDKQAIKQTLEEEARKCHWLVLWLDCDREGENIAYEVVEVCTGANRNLNIFRARFSALIDRYWLLWIVCFANVAQIPYLYPVVITFFFKIAGKYMKLFNILEDQTSSLLMLWMQDR